MKIAIVSSTFPPYKGGMGNAAFYVAQELSRRGHEITVFTPGNNVGINDKFIFKVIRLIPWLKYGNSSFCPQLLWRLWSFNKIYLVYPFFGGAEFVWLLKKIKGKKIIFFMNYQMNVSLPGLLGKVINFHSKFILPRIAKSANLVSFLSMDHGHRSLLKNLINKYPHKFIGVPNGVDAEKFISMPEQEIKMFKKKLAIMDDEQVLMFCGGLDKAHYFKGVENLLLAFQKIILENKKIKLLIVGDGDLKKYYQDLAVKLDIVNKVIFSGEFNHNNLVYFYNVCDIFILPSIHSESFGIVLIEAMSCRKPVIATNLPGVRKTFVDKENGFLVEPGNIDELADKIKKVLRFSQAERDEIGKKAREMVLQKYTWGKITDTIEEKFKL